MRGAIKMRTVIIWAHEICAKLTLSAADLLSYNYNITAQNIC